MANINIADNLGSIGIWQGIFDSHPAQKIRESVAELERMGWKCIWSPEAMGRDVMVTSSIVLSSSDKLFAATGIAQIHARHPMTTAAAQKTLAEAHQNRFVLGIGVSHGPLVENMRGMSYDKPLAQMKDYIQKMREATFISVEPETPPPLILAALGPKMLELSATVADGAHPYNTVPSHTAEARKIMGPDAFLAPEQKVILETDPEKAREAAKAAIGFYAELPNYTNNFKRMGFSDEDISSQSDKFLDGLFAWGDMDTIKARINEHLEAGADHVAVQAITAPGNRELPMAEWTALAAELL